MSTPSIPKRYSPLHTAAIEGDAEAAYLLADRDNVNVKTADGFTALYLATVNGRSDVVAALMTKQPCILVSNGKEGTTALHAAARRGETAILRQFLPFVRFGVHTALFEAVEGGQLEAVQLLIEWGADVNGEGPDQNTPLHVAALRGDVAMVEYLSRVPDIQREKRNKQDFTPLASAAMKGQLGTVEALLNAGSDPFAPCGPDRWTPMHVAAHYGRGEIIKRLSQISGLVNHKAKARFQYFVPKYTPQELKKLFQTYGITIDLSQTYLTPLFLAAASGSLAAVEALLEAGAPIQETCGPLLETALFGAVRGKDVSVLERLCRVPGIDIEQTTVDGMTPIIVVILDGNLKMLDCIIRAGAQLNIQTGPKKSGPLLLAVENMNTDLVLRLLQEGSRIDKNIRDGEGYSALIRGVDSGALQIVDALLKEGADPTVVYGEKKRTVLHLAAEKGDLGIVRRLCEDPRVEINRRDSGGYSSLELAEEQKHLGVVEFLLSKGAKRSPAREDLKTARELIAKKRKHEAKKYLLRGQKLDPHNFHIPYLLGKIANNEQLYPEAETYIQGALRLWEIDVGPSHKDESGNLVLDMYATLADNAFLQNIYPQALKYYAKITLLNPQNAQAHHNEGIAHFMLGDYKKTEECLRNGLKYDGDDSYMWHRLGEALRMQKRYEEAGQCYGKAQSKNPKNSDAFIGLAHLEVIKNDLGKAKSLIDEALKLSTNNSQAYYVLGLIAEAENKPEEAEKQYHKAHRTHNQNYQALLSLARLASRQGDLPKAREYYRAALIVNPYNPEAQTGLKRSPAQTHIDTVRGIVSNMEVERVDEALKLLAEGRKLDPQNYQIPLLEGRLAKWKSRPEAQHCFLEALKLSREGDYLDEIYSELAGILVDQKNYAEAISYFEKLVPHKPINYLNLSMCFAKLGDYVKSESHARAYVKYAPHEWNGWEFLGEALLMQKKFDEASISFKIVIAKNPGNPEAYVHLASIAEAQNKPGEA